MTEKLLQHSRGKRIARLHYRVCPRCRKRFSDLEAHYRAKHLKNDRKRLKAFADAERV